MTDTQWKAWVEAKLEDHDRQLTVLSTGVAIARWVGPFVVAIAAVAISLWR